MNTGLIIASIFLVIGIILYNISTIQKKNLENNYRMKGILIKYKRFGKYLNPIIEFTENGEKKIIKKIGLANNKPIKVGSEIRILKKENGKYLTDVDIRVLQSYAISFILVSILAFFIICLS